MSTTPCTRCGRTLPPDVVRELARGTRCPFCAATLERPKPKNETPLYGTPAAKNPAFATTSPGRARALEPGAFGSGAVPASAEAKAWLNALLKPDATASASPLAAAASAAAASPAPTSPPILKLPSPVAAPAVAPPAAAPAAAAAAEPPPVAPAPAAAAPLVEPPPVAPAPAAAAPLVEPPPVAPAPAAAAPLVEPAPVAPAPATAAPDVDLPSDKRPTVPMAAYVDTPEKAEPLAPLLSLVAAHPIEPPPLPADALAELADEPPPPVKAQPPAAPPPPPVAEAAPRVAVMDDSEALIVPVGNRRPRVVIAVGAVLMGGVLALVLRGAQPEEQPAPIAETPAASLTPAAAPVEAPRPVDEIALDPTGAPKASAPLAALKAAPAPAPTVDETPRARHHRSSGDGDEQTASADADDAETYRRQGLAYEKEGKVQEALAAYREYLPRAKRTRDRVAIARRMYDLTHPGE